MKKDLEKSSAYAKHQGSTGFATGCYQIERYPSLAVGCRRPFCQGLTYHSPTRQQHRQFRP